MSVDKKTICDLTQINFTSKRNFISEVSRASKSDRSNFIKECLLLARPRLALPSLYVTDQWRRCITQLTSKFLLKHRLSNNLMWRLWVFVSRDLSDLPNWQLPRNQCYRQRSVSDVTRLLGGQRPKTHQQRRQQARRP
jgi:hypothetical protein